MFYFLHLPVLDSFRNVSERVEYLDGFVALALEGRLQADLLIVELLNHQHRPDRGAVPDELRLALERLPPRFERKRAFSLVPQVAVFLPACRLDVFHNQLKVAMTPTCARGRHVPALPPAVAFAPAVSSDPDDPVFPDPAAVVVPI